MCPLTGGREQKEGRKEASRPYLCLFVLADLIVDPAAVINLSCEDNYILSPSNPSSESTECVGGLGDPQNDEG